MTTKSIDSAQFLWFRLTAANPLDGWSDGTVPLSRRGVRVSRLIAWVRNVPEKGPITRESTRSNKHGRPRTTVGLACRIEVINAT